MTALPHAVLLDHLTHGKIQVEGFVPWGSNRTFVVQVEMEEDGAEITAVYKPQQGERPLWDFPTGTLCQRERAAYLVSQALGWELVPPTILRDGPAGWGSLQYFIEHDPNEHYFTFQAEHPEPLAQIALFDLLLNNADRKGGHIIRDSAGKLWGIDHGLAFHHEPKLRTVVWEFAGLPIPPHLCHNVESLGQLLTGGEAEAASAVLGELRELLSEVELAALHGRVTQLLTTGQFTQPGRGRPYPWPLV